MLTSATSYFSKITSFLPSGKDELCPWSKPRRRLSGHGPVAFPLCAGRGWRHVCPHQEQSCAQSMSLQSPALTASHDHSPIFRGVSALITFFHQLNMAARFPKILFTTAAPIFALFRLLGLHWSSRKHEAADAGVRDRRFDRLSCMGLPDSVLNRSAFRSARSCRLDCHVSATGVSRVNFRGHPQPSWLTSEYLRSRVFGTLPCGAPRSPVAFGRASRRPATPPGMKRPKVSVERLRSQSS